MDVSAGVIVDGQRVLVCRRAAPRRHAGLWEFPGGRREAGETAAQCLRRELREELDLDVSVGAPVARVECPRDDGGTIRLTFLLATVAGVPPRCLEHQEIRWLTPDALAGLDFCPADACALPDIIRAIGLLAEGVADA